MDSYSYTPLNFSKNEIRVLKFLDSSGTDSPELIHCTLQNVSLDDYLRGFADLLVEMRLKCGPAATRSWMKLGDSRPDHTWLPTVQIPVASWRRNPRTLNLTSLGVDTEFLPEEYENSIQIVAAPTPEESQLLAIKPPREPSTFNFPPRFNWGDFEAVSYCWESDVRERTIIVDGKPLRIAKSLEGFLQRYIFRERMT